MIGIWIGIYVGLNRWQNEAEYEYKEVKNPYDLSRLQMNTE